MSFEKDGLALRSFCSDARTDVFGARETSHDARTAVAALTHTGRKVARIMPTTTKPIRFALPVFSGVEAPEFRSFTDSLRTLTGVPFTILPVATHAGIESVVERGVADIAWAPPLVALDLVSLGAARVFAAASRAGRTAYPSLLVVGRETAIRHVGDLAGRRVAWVSSRSAAGYEVPRLFLEACGLPLDRLFSRETMTGSHLGALDAVRTGRADVAACYGVKGDTPASVELPLRLDDVRIVAVAGAVPSDVLIARRKLDPALLDIVVRGLLRLDDGGMFPLRKLLGVDQLVRASSDHLASLSSLRRLARFASDTSLGESS